VRLNNLREKSLFWLSWCGSPIFVLILWLKFGCVGLDCNFWGSIYMLPLYAFFYLAWLASGVFAFLVLGRKKQKRFELR
jgi:hypothetical protein